MSFKHDLQEIDQLTQENIRLTRELAAAVQRAEEAEAERDLLVRALNLLGGEAA